MQYTQLTEDERIEIYALKKAGFSKLAIARQLERDPKTIREEIARNTGVPGKPTPRLSNGAASRDGLLK